MPIRLVDVTEMGVVLATTVISDEGAFVFELADPLPAGHTIGLMIGDLSGTPFNAEDFRHGPTYYERPMVGTLVDMVSTQPAE